MKAKPKAAGRGQPRTPPSEPEAPPPDPVPTDLTATVHRAADAPALGRWLRAIQNLWPALTSADQTNLAAVGAGMSAWQRETLLRILTDANGRRRP